MRTRQEPQRFNVGDHVTLGRHGNIRGIGTGWYPQMSLYVGMVARIESVLRIDGLWYAHINLDGEVHAWRQRNMTIHYPPAPTLTATTTHTGYFAAKKKKKVKEPENVAAVKPPAYLEHVRGYL